MSTYTPDRWVIVRITPKNEEIITPHYRVFAGWWGGYAGSDSWKLSSGNEGVIEHPDYWEVVQHSGSTYNLYKGCWGYTGYMTQVFHHSLHHPDAPFYIEEVNLDEFPIHQCI